jgi:hypothetical protein
MTTTYYLTVSLHVLAALFWLGGMLFVGAVGAPVLRAVEPPELRQRIFRDLGLRFRAAGWWAIAVLVVTGVLQLRLRGLLRWDGVLGDAAFWATPLGIAQNHAPTGSPSGAALRRRAALLARVNALVGIVVVLAAVRLARGG